MNFFRAGVLRPNASSESDIVIPFRQPLPSGTSDFEVPVSRMFCRNRCFSFPHLAVVPGFFCQQAAKLDFDTEDELKAETTEYVSFSAAGLHHIPGILEENRIFDIANYNDLTTVVDYVKKFNNFFLENKPPHMRESPFFIDWMDDRFIDKPLDELFEHVQMLHMMYFGEDENHLEFTTGVHDTGLPEKLKHLPEANYLSFPEIPLAKELHGKIGLRLHLAPMTKLVSSTKGIFNFLGFNSDMHRALNTGDHPSRYVFLNDTDSWRIIRPSRPMPENLGKVIKHQIRMGHSRNDIRTGEIFFQLSERASRKNATLVTQLEPIFSHISKSTNIQIGVGFSNSTSKFNISFPSAINSRILMSSNLQQRMGLGVNEPVIATTEPKTRADEEKDIEGISSEEKARALVFDTGTIICTPAREMTPSAMSLAENFMVTLHPRMSGILETKRKEGLLPNRIPLDDLRFGSENEVKLRFRLHRYLDNGDIVPFGWKVNSYVTGELLCTPMSVC
jgi:hypothetical protein